MSAYLICMVRVDDPETYKKYTAKTPDFVAKYGGKFLVRGGAVEAIEGPEFKDRLVLLEFPSIEHVKQFHGSPEYQEIVQYRHAIHLRTSQNEHAMTYRAHRTFELPEFSNLVLKNR
jgi:uncharacterized protein (DUF1330 family)